MPNEVEDAPSRAYLSFVGYTGLFQGLNRNTGEDCALFLFHRAHSEGTKGKKKDEKIDQAGHSGGHRWSVA